MTGLALGFFLMTLMRATAYAPDAEIIPPAFSSEAARATSSLPSRLIIPALNIDTKVQHVGIKPNGKMANPNNFSDVGWYKYGTVPGASGSAVMAGHVDNALGLDGIFKHLEKLKTGDEIFVVTRGGARLHFIVTDSEWYPYTEVPIELLFNKKDKPRLNLVTCGGTWIKDARSYDKRLVVFTKLAD